MFFFVNMIMFMPYKALDVPYTISMNEMIVDYFIVRVSFLFIVFWQHDRAQTHSQVLGVRYRTCLVGSSAPM